MSKNFSSLLLVMDTAQVVICCKQ